ncbi:DUF2892 domain-containing protein [Campylobacter sp. RM9328]|uniref:YgaP family membrane protein n=1 Tax=Campylobacter sp. RM9328 TaxID=1705720 RepID=UPI0014747355|nr:DUF2892 domain-containing protein [Campylobacter sp. RM9328]
MVSKKSRIFRVIFGLFLMVGVWLLFKSYWALIGLVPIIIGITGYCPACQILGKCSLKR